MSEYVTYDQAIKLKELGFNDEIYFYYSCDNKDKVYYVIDPDDHKLTAFNHNQFDHNNLSHFYTTSAPTYTQAFKWFRDKHKLFALPIITDHPDGYIFSFSTFKQCKSNITQIHKQFDESDYKETQEEAESVCLDYLIKLIS